MGEQRGRRGHRASGIVTMGDPKILLKIEQERCFQIQDKDGDGGLDPQEMATFLRALGLSPDNATIKSFGPKLSLDDAIKKYEELAAKEAKQTEESLLELFEAWDPGHRTGEVSFAEFARGLTIFGKGDGENFSDEEITRLKATLGIQSEDQPLKYKQVIKLLLQTNQPHLVASLSDDPEQ